MSTAKMLRYMASNAVRRGCLPLNGVMEPFVSERFAGPRTCRRATNSAAFGVLNRALHTHLETGTGAPVPL